MAMNGIFCLTDRCITGTNDNAPIELATALTKEYYIHFVNSSGSGCTRIINVVIAINNSATARLLTLKAKIIRKSISSHWPNS